MVGRRGRLIAVDGWSLLWMVGRCCGWLLTAVDSWLPWLLVAGVSPVHRQYIAGLSIIVVIIVINHDLSAALATRAGRVGGGRNPIRHDPTRFAA